MLKTLTKPFSSSSLLYFRGLDEAPNYCYVGLHETGRQISKMARIKICKEDGCQNAATTKGYCRLHYLRNWRTIKEEERNKAAKRLNSYISSMCKDHPERYMDKIKENIRSSGFEQEIDKTLGTNREENLLFDDPTYEEEIEKLIEDLKVEKGF